MRHLAEISECLPDHVFIRAHGFGSVAGENFQGRKKIAALIADN